MMRADQWLVHQGSASSRAQAQRLVASGGVQWQLPSGEWKTVVKNGDEIPESAPVRLLNDAEARYVSRGGLKLEGALAAIGAAHPSGVSPQSMVQGTMCLDVGQSTGGFTDCLLQYGAVQVVGLDVGQGQLHPKLRADPRVICIEHVNARNLTPDDIMVEGVLCPDAAQTGGGDAPAMPLFQWLVGDVSFISSTLVLPAVVPFLAPQGHLLWLIKPQFELQPGQVGKGGIVRDAAMYAVVEQRIRDACTALGLQVLQWLDSPIEGGDGNREFFVFARRAP